MKNIILQNWFKICVIILILVGTTILLWQIFHTNKILTCEERAQHCLELGSDKRASACLSLLGINYKFDDSKGMFADLFKKSLKDACKQNNIAQ